LIDSQGFRANVGIIVANERRQVLFARRIGQDAWQFPQGGIKADESPEDALYRELYEELGLNEADVELIGATQGWLKYHLPKRFIRRGSQPLCIGQKQRWFLLMLRSQESSVQLDVHDKPEFDHWKWVNYWRPQREVIFFKRRVYRQALEELAPLLGVSRRVRRGGRRRRSGRGSDHRGPERGVESAKERKPSRTDELSPAVGRQLPDPIS
jgi:putative (di)nucleoside polyphosphate hydrolase